MKRKAITVLASSATSVEDLSNIALATFECPECYHKTTANANSDPCCHYCGNIKEMAKVADDVVEAHVHDADDSDELARVVCAACQSPNILPLEHVARLEDDTLHCVVCSVPMTLQVEAEMDDDDMDEEEDMSGDDVDDDIEESAYEDEDEDEDEDEGMDEVEVDVEESSFEETAAGVKKFPQMAKGLTSKTGLHITKKMVEDYFDDEEVPEVDKALKKLFGDDYQAVMDNGRVMQLLMYKLGMVKDGRLGLGKKLSDVVTAAPEEAGAFGKGYNKDDMVEDYYDGEGNTQSTQDPNDPMVDRVDQFKTEDGVDHSTQDPMDMMEMSTATLFDVLASTDVEREVEFVRASNRVLCLVDDTHVATLAKTEETANADIFETEAYVQAIEASVADNGLKETLESYQFELSAIKLDEEVLSSYVDQKLRSQHGAEVASVKTDYQDHFKQSLEIAATGLNRGLFTEHSHALKDRLVNDLEVAGVRNARHLVDVAFADTEDEHVANLMEIASDLVGRNADYRNDLAEGLTKMSSPVTAKVVEESTALEQKLTSPFMVESSVTPATATRGVGGTVKSILARSRARRTR